MTTKKEIEEIFSKSVRSGRRTYFFDVRSTRANDYYLTITESKRDFNEDGSPFYKKHKIYLYKEDFASFKNALSQVSEFIIKEKGEEIISNTKYKEKIKIVKDENPKDSKDSESNFTEVDLNDLS
ncbi:MAG: PUR family DNA/RNA-binding protein [Flavobacteriales bacterium]|jgi:hypothetical protein|nr:PUR family DNA/RNA-binding protein [Flavobacteriales bacterium]|tara:strand:+ start:4857 stop:5231 length:375 start_codon:yes stop_codon:yes gene_type:complete